MPLFLLIVAVMFLVPSVRGAKYTDELFKTLKSDFTGPNNFIIWGVAIFLIGAVGYWKPAKPISNAFMLLVVVVIFLSNGGFFNKFLQQIRGTETPGANVADTASSFLPGGRNNPLEWDGGSNAPGQDGAWITLY